MGARERGEGGPLASWGDSSVGGWHVTAVTVLWGGDLLRPLIQLRHTAPLSDPAAWFQPLWGQYWSLVRRTSCPRIQSSPAEAPPPTYSPANQLAIHSSANQPLKFKLWHSGKEKGQQGCVLNTPTGGEADLITSWEWLWWSSCPDLSSGYTHGFPNGLRGCRVSRLVWKCLIWDDEKAIAISRLLFILLRRGWPRQWQLPITSAYKEQTIRPGPVTTASPTSPDLCSGPTSEHSQVNRQWYCTEQELGAEVNQTAAIHITYYFPHKGQEEGRSERKRPPSC